MSKKLSFVLVLLIWAGAMTYGQELKVMSYNLRYDKRSDGENVWENRRNWLLSQLEYYEPDIIGTQEGLENQLKWLDENLPDYNYLGIGRDPDTGKGTGEHNAVFYNKKRLDVKESGTFWLSENPGAPGKGWDAACNRICTYVLFRDKKSNKMLFVFNTHFDHMGNTARLESAKLILKKVKEINKKNYPLIFMGDLNLSPGQEPVNLLGTELNDSRAVSLTKPFGPDATFNNFDVCKSPDELIDYIFTSKHNIIVNKYAVIANVWNVHYASDHYPVLISIVLSK